MATNLPPELLAQQQELTRQQRMADLLMGQGTQQPQGQMVSGQYVAPSFFQNLIPLANAYAGKKMSEKADQKSLDLAKALRTRNQEDAQNYITAMTPTTQTTEMAGPYGMSGDGQNVPMPTATRDVGPDYAKAFQVAYNSYDPALRAQAMDMIKTQKLGEGETLSRMNFGTGQLDSFASGGMKLAPEVKAAAQSLGILTPIDTWTPEQRAAVDNKMIQLKKSGASNSTAISNVMAFEPFANKVQGDMGSALVKNFDTLQGIPTQIATLKQVQELAPKSFAGSLAQQKLEAAKFLNNNLGLNVAVDKVGNTEVLNTVLFTNIMDNLKKMDAQPSQMQQMEMKKGLGNIGTDPAALPRVVKVYTDILEAKAREHNRRVAEAESGPSKIKFPYSINIPLEQQNASPNAGGANTGEVEFNSLQPRRQR